MFLVRAWTSSWIFVSALLVVPCRADATDLRKLSEQLVSASDFRVRTQAALALGASKDKRAHPLLCKALHDPSSSVRAGAAAALGKLNKGGEDCLRKRLASETVGHVKTVMTKALSHMVVREVAEQLPSISSTTKYYIALDTVDATSRGGHEVASLVRRTILEAAAGNPVVAIAPDGETAAEAKKALQGKKQVKGFLLSTKVKPPEYATGTLTVRVEVAIFTYPDKNLKGTASRTLSMQGVSQPDAAAEDELLKSAAQHVLEAFLKTAEKIR